MKDETGKTVFKVNWWWHAIRTGGREGKSSPWHQLQRGQGLLIERPNQSVYTGPRTSGCLSSTLYSVCPKVVSVRCWHGWGGQHVIKELPRDQDLLEKERWVKGECSEQHQTWPMRYSALHKCDLITMLCYPGQVQRSLWKTVKENKKAAVGAGGRQSL